MKIICFIDSLNSGGAQRQISMLAILLKKKGHDIQMLTYHNLMFFGAAVEKNGIPIIILETNNKIGRIKKFLAYINRNKPDAIISFLNSPNMIAEISSIFLKNHILITSERSLGFNGSVIKIFFRYFLHLLADAVVTNSHSQNKFLTNIAPWLKGRLQTIINCVDIEQFSPTENFINYPKCETNFAVVARFEEVKQPLFVLSALEIIKNKHINLHITINWFGNNFFTNGIPTKKSDTYLKLKEEITNKSLNNNFRLHEPTQEIVKVYHNCSALILPSLYEGCSNVICEAMACGKPVLASRVGDNSFLVEDGVNGFLFDPKSPEDMAEKMMKFASLPPEDKLKMGEAGREKAVKLLSPERFCNEFIQLIESIKEKRMTCLSKDNYGPD